MTNLGVTELAIGNIDSDTNVCVLLVEQVVCVAPSFILVLRLQPCLNTFDNFARYLVDETSTASGERSHGIFFSVTHDLRDTSERIICLAVEHVSYYCLQSQ